jgi:hypothetical protein
MGRASGDVHGCFVRQVSQPYAALDSWIAALGRRGTRALMSHTIDRQIDTTGVGQMTTSQRTDDLTRDVVPPDVRTPVQVPIARSAVSAVGEE